MTSLTWFVLGVVVALFGALAWVRLSGFTAQRPADYNGQKPAFDLRTHLSGPIKCEGAIYGPTGRVVSRFVGDFEAHWDGSRGVMNEYFLYDSGSTQTREWRLQLGNDGRITAEADDLVGTGRGRQEGSAVNLNYTIRLPVEAGGYVLNVTDWMYLAPNGVIVNRIQFRKFGIKVAELVATMRRVDTV